MHIIHSVLCYPSDQPPEPVEQLPDGVELVGNHEVYDFQTASQVPQVGEGLNFPEGRWSVTAVESYYPEQVSAIGGVHVAICTQDGQPLERRDDSSQFRVLTLRMQGDTIVERAPGLADWAIGSELWIPHPAASREVLLFKPQGPRPPKGFDVVAICRTSAVATVV